MKKSSLNIFLSFSFCLIWDKDFGCLDSCWLDQILMVSAMENWLSTQMNVNRKSSGYQFTLKVSYSQCMLIPLSQVWMEWPQVQQEALMGLRYYWWVSCLFLTSILNADSILSLATKNNSWTEFNNFCALSFWVLNLYISVDGCDELRPTGPATLPGTGASWAALSTAALHPHICGSSTQTPATATFRGLPAVYRRTQCWVHYCQQMGPNTLGWVRRQTYIML